MPLGGRAIKGPLRVCKGILLRHLSWYPHSQAQAITKRKTAQCPPNHRRRELPRQGPTASKKFPPFLPKQSQFCIVQPQHPQRSTSIPFKRANPIVVVARASSPWIIDLPWARCSCHFMKFPLFSRLIRRKSCLRIQLTSTSDCCFDWRGCGFDPAIARRAGNLRVPSRRPILSSANPAHRAYAWAFPEAMKRQIPHFSAW